MDTLLEKLISIIVPSNCTDRLQPLDLSVHKPMKDHLHAHFCKWYAEKVSDRLSKGTAAEDIKVDTRLSILKELQAQLIISACDHIRSSLAFALNGFKAAGLLKAIEQPDTLSDSSSEDDDPFLSGSSLKE